MAEVVIVVPVIMMVVLVSVQACLWVYADTLVQAAAAAGEQSAAVAGDTPGTAESSADGFLSRSGSTLVTDPQVTVSSLPGAGVSVEVTGQAEQILPWLHLPVSAVRDGPVQEFRSVS